MDDFIPLLPCLLPLLLSRADEVFELAFHLDLIALGLKLQPQTDLFNFAGEHMQEAPCLLLGNLHLIKKLGAYQVGILL
jgi:hypothetical protein